MTEQNKTDIRRLRSAGHSYTQIAEILHLSRNTVKSICQRYAFLPDAEVDATHDQEHCQNCGTRIVQAEGQKQRIFCLTACRRAWWKTHRTSGTKKTAVPMQCATCGRKFEDYTRNQRKYCCHACYIRDRFVKKVTDDQRAI